MKIIFVAALLFFSTTAFGTTYWDFCKNRNDTVKFSERRSSPPYGLYVRCYDSRGNETYKLFIAGCINVKVEKYDITIIAKGTTRKDIGYDVKCGV